jgi:photosystem II stability/assembly factor-like uncharacterized protein
MKKIQNALLLTAAATTLFVAGFEFAQFREREPRRPSPEKHREAVDNDWFMLQRAYPNNDIKPEAYEAALQAISTLPAVGSDILTPTWQLAGPTNIGGRITCIALHPTNSNLIYAGAATGGVWKSNDNGTTWSNIFNESSSIGSLLLDPTNPQTIYVGTGEGNPGGVAIYPGNGMWRSTDAGQTWMNLGLVTTGQIGKIAIHSSSPNRIFVAALGLYRSKTLERGIYRSTDGGTTWQQVLFVNDTTGACDVMIDSADPNRVIAASWTRHRPLTYSTLKSSSSGLWLSTNGGNVWSRISNGLPVDENVGRTCLASSPSQPNIYYALFSDGTGVRGTYRSSNSGTSWSNTSASFGGESQVWYNNVISVHPTDPNIILAGMTYGYKSTDGGAFWSQTAGSVHVDFHAIEYDKNNPNKIVLGTDGGVFISTNGGNTWSGTGAQSIPITQFYAGTIDFSNPQHLLGGTQDNGTPRTLTGTQNNWSSIYGGDGFYVLVDPTNSNRIYAESQWGGLGYTTDGGSSFFDGINGIDFNDRTNWSTPVAMNLSSPLTLYAGTFRVYKTTNGMENWTPISGDLTRGNGGRIGTISTIDASTSNANVVYVGTDDGKVQVTTNGGTLWNDVTGTLPRRWVTRVTVDPDSAQVCYVTLSGYLEYQFQAHIYRTSNFGQTWIPIGGNLPNIPLNDVVVDPEPRRRLFVASDAGVLFSTNMGADWFILGNGLPAVPVHDLAFHSPTKKLVAFTHGRSVWSADVSTLTSVEQQSVVEPTAIQLYQNYPNPFNPSTRIRFTMKDAGHVTLKVFDTIGREVAMVVDGFRESGMHEETFIATSLASGVYFYRLEAGALSATKKLTIVK